MLLRCLSILAILVSFALPVHAKVSVVKPCPSQVALLACSIEAVAHSSQPRIVVESASCPLKGVSVSRTELEATQQEHSVMFVPEVSERLKGILDGGIERPPKDFSI